MGKKYFGTDGIRGEVGKGAIHPEFVQKLGWAAGKAFAEHAGHKGAVLIGKDTRISGYMFESALEAGLSAAGVDVKLLGPMPTPGVAYLTRAFRGLAGIVISASHNPYHDNGIKFFSAEGTKLPDELEAKIEAYIDEPFEVVASDQLGKTQRVEDARGRFVEFCKHSVPASIGFHGLKIVLDCAHGATYNVAPHVFREMGAEIITIGAEPNGLNINKDVGSTSPSALQQKVLEEQADLGIAFDGDGDRVLFVDNKGEILDGDDLLFIIAHHRQKAGVWQGGVVGTVMTNLGLETALSQKDIPFVRAAVGDRHVMEAMVANDWQLGGENSGHIICRDVASTGDGIVSALQVLRAMSELGESLFDLKKGWRRCPQKLKNVRTKKAKTIMQDERLLATIAEAEQALAGKGRVLLRPSGTEPLLRVMVEAQEPHLVDEWVDKLAQAVESLS